MVKRYKIDLLTALLLMFLAVVVSLVLYLRMLNHNIQLYGQQINETTKLRLLNKDLNYFSLQKSASVNFNIIHQKNENFESTLHKLHNIMIKNNVDDVLLKTIATIERERSLVHKSHISSKLDFLHNMMKEHYQQYITTNRNILTVLIFSIVLMIILIGFLHQKSLRDKIELEAYKFAIENSDNSIVITDTNQNITYVNEAFERETGYNKEDVLGSNPRVLQSGLVEREQYTALNKALQNHQKWEGEFINKRKDGTLFYEKASITPIIIDHEVVSYIAIKLNITDYIQQEKKVEFLALHDQLTSLPNRLHFERYFQDSVLSNNQTVALLYIDLDRFKNINDSLGHHIGDALLKVFTKRLQYALSEKDFLARIGGDEFVVISHVHSAQDAGKVAQRILQLLQTPIQTHGHSLNITSSIGVSFYPNDGDTLDTLMKYADTAMYRAKSIGRNNFQFFTQELSEEIGERLAIEQALQNALGNHEFYMVYQPKYDIKTHQILGFEALIRWENESLGFVPPDKFIPIAEEIGVINAIGYFVFEQACADFKTFLQIDPNLKRIAINISTVQLNQKDFMETIGTMGNHIGIQPSQIELEVTETYIMDDIERNIQTLQKLRKKGYKIAIDDFGTGYSSFGYLKRLPVNTIKIDKSFVDDITLHQQDKDIVSAIIGLSKNLGFSTVAEGIEYQEQEALLAEMGCDIGQGYFFSKPQKAASLKVFIQERMRVEITA